MGNSIIYFFDKNVFNMPTDKKLNMNSWIMDRVTNNHLSIKIRWFFRYPKKEMPIHCLF